MEETSFEVNQTMTGLARSLRHYVSSEQFAEDRRMIELLREARGMAIDAAQASELKAFHRMDTPLQRIGMSIHSVSAFVWLTLDGRSWRKHPWPTNRAKTTHTP